MNTSLTENITRLNSQLQAEIALYNIATTDPILKKLVDQFKPLLHSSSKLYGSCGCLGFKASKDLLTLVPELFDKLIPTQQASGNWYYSGFPANETAREIIKKKDSKVTFNLFNDIQFEYGVNGFKASFYYELEADQVISITIDFSNVIIGQRYNQFPREIRIPYLAKNPRYTQKTRTYETEYKGVNFECNTNNFSVYRVKDLADFLEITEQFFTEKE